MTIGLIVTEAYDVTEGEFNVPSASEIQDESGETLEEFLNAEAKRKLIGTIKIALPGQRCDRNRSQGYRP